MVKADERETAPHLLVVIDHQEARVYRTEVHGAIPVRIAPYDPHGYRKHLHSAHEWTDGKRQPERKSFYEAVAKTLQGAEQVFLFGSGTGRSSAMEMLSTMLRASGQRAAEQGRNHGARSRSGRGWLPELAGTLGQCGHGRPMTPTRE
jgi:hypothetical protein